MHAKQKFMISSLLEGIVWFFFLYNSYQFLPDKWNLAKKNNFQILSNSPLSCAVSWLKNKTKQNKQTNKQTNK